MTKTRLLAVLGGLALAGCLASCPKVPPGPGPTGGTAGVAPVPVAGAAGAAGAPVATGGQPSQTLEQRACEAANAKCSVDVAECLKQVARLRTATYAHLSDSDLQCWIDAKDAMALTKCPNGVCR